MYIRDLIYGAGILKPTSPTNRILRRALIFGIIAVIGQLVVGVPETVNPIYQPIIIALLGGIDKALREIL